MRCVAVFPNLTSAQRCCRRLSAAAIPAEVVKVDSARTRRGCSWGAAFPASDSDAVRVILRGSGLGEREIISEDE